MTDVLANNARGPTPAAAPQVLTLTAPAEGRYYVAVSRAKVGSVGTGDFGAFVLTLDEVARLRRPNVDDGDSAARPRPRRSLGRVPFLLIANPWASGSTRPGWPPFGPRFRRAPSCG